MDEPRIIWVDTETTGLEPERHEIWNIAWEIWEGDTHHSKEEFKVQPLRLHQASPQALRVNQFYRRFYRSDGYEQVSPNGLAEMFAGFSTDAYLAGCGTHFDAKMIEALLRAQGFAPAWHHRIIDIESMAMGVMGWPHPKGLSEMIEEFGITLDPDKRHTAGGDLDATIQIYEAIQDRSGDPPTRQMEVP